MEKGSVRRRILKGSLAAPVVLTVSSASASALTSFGRCLRNSAASDARPAFFADAERADGWYRRPVSVDQLSFEGQVRGFFYRDPMLGRYVDVREPYAVLSFGSTALPEGWRVTGESKRWALVYFNTNLTSEYRHITLQRPSGHSPTTVSCYGSFALGRTT